LREAPEATDEELADRARRGDADAFEQLYARHAPALRREIRRRLPGSLRRKVAESDVIQMAFLGVHRNLSGFSGRGDGSFRAWLTRIVDHKVRNVLRSFVHVAKRSVRREVTDAQAMIAGPQPTPSAVAVAEELRGRIRHALERLPQDYRTVLRLVQEDGLRLAEAARIMERSPAAIEKLYGRALAKLAVLVETTGGGDGSGQPSR
jgi:RNA polymerase sigma-70 factor (ECF subfamily)